MEWEHLPLDDGVQIAYAREGTGEPLVLVPGWTVSGEVFEHQIAEFGGAFQAITFDPRCHGRSSDTTNGNSYPQQGRDLASVLNALELDEVHLVGWSYGGLACYAYADQYGIGRVRSLTIIDQPPKPLGRVAPGEWIEHDLDGYLADFIGPVVADPDGFAGEFAEWLLDRAPTTVEREWLTGMHLRTPRHAAECLVVSTMFSDYLELAARISTEIPLANVVRQDSLRDAEPWLARHLPNATMWTMRSHLGFWDEPAEFNRQLRVFLER